MPVREAEPWASDEQFPAASPGQGGCFDVRY